MSDKPYCDQGHNGRCCCNCQHHLRDHSHPVTDGKSILVPRGWICYPPDFNGAAFSGWGEHGMCEMHDYAKTA